MRKNKNEITASDGETVSIRPLASDDDIQGLMQFRDSISPATQTNFAPHNYTEKVIRAYIKRNERGEDLIFLAWSGTEVIAYFFLWEFDQEVPVLGIGIRDDFQGRGLGRRLMQILLDEARNAGKEGVALTVMPDNERAVNLYKAMGFSHSRDVENLQEGGKVLIVPEMFYPLKPGAKPPLRKHAPPVL